MVVSKTMIKNAALSGIYDGPASILSKVNDLLCEGNEDDMFVTVWLGILTISTGEMVSACAGHEYPVFYRKGKGFILEKDSHGIPMGGMTGIYYKECTWKLDPGDMLFLYTDGLPEAINSEEEQFGTDRMLEALEKGIDLSAQNGEAGYDRAGLKELLRQVRRQVDDFVGDTPQFDDMTMLCLKYR
jgi:sigma-B regulation protein RsbU (phosphoserine phosphatase)